MNPDLEEMMRSTLPPEETSVSAIIAEYLVEKSQVFKGLTDLRLKVLVLCISYGTPPPLAKKITSF